MPASDDRLQRPLAALLTDGGDGRLRVDPATGLNAYGCSPQPRPAAITFASTTATSVSVRGYAAAAACRDRLLAAPDRAAAWRAETAEIRAGIRAHYGLADDVAVILTPSGTDGELAALALHRLAADGRDSVNLVIAPEETGTGVQLAAAGRHFADTTARGVAVARGTPVEGLAASVASVAIRAPDGALRPRTMIEAEVAALTASALARGAHVLLHGLDVSKTGLLAPGFDCAAGLARDGGGAVDVLVDACQARLGAAAARRYLAAGFMLLVTGSKFFTGPPFAGALLLPPAIAARLRGPRPLAAGLAAYAGRAEWPDDAPAAEGLPAAINHGLLLRWTAALAEMRAFAAAPASFARDALARFTQAVGDALAVHPDLLLHPVPPPGRGGDPAEWDELGTVFSVSVRAPDGAGLLDLESLRRLYRAINTDLSGTIDGSDHALAARPCHIGQPVALAPGLAALRLSAGARIVSGALDDASLGPDPEARLAREIADALTVLDKIALVRRHWDALIRN